MLPSSARIRAVTRRYAISKAEVHGFWNHLSWKPPVAVSTTSTEASVYNWAIVFDAYLRKSSVSRSPTSLCNCLQKINPQEAACMAFSRHVHKLSAGGECQSRVQAHDEKEVPRSPSRTTGKSGPGTMAKSLVQIVMSLSHVKEEVYGALDKWAAFELKFPLEATMNALKRLRDKNQWHRVIQVSKWMLSKGIGKTNGTYSIMLKAYCMDGRLDDAEALWEKVITLNNRSTPKNMFSYMIHIYRKHEMPEKVIQIFEQMESFGIKPDVDMLRQVREAYYQLGTQEKQDELTKKYPLNSKQRRNERRIAERKSAKIHGENAPAVNPNELPSIKPVLATQASMTNEPLNSDCKIIHEKSKGFKLIHEKIKVNELETVIGPSETINLSGKISSSSRKHLRTVQTAQHSPETHQKPKGEDKVYSNNDIDFIEKIIATM